MSEHRHHTTCATKRSKRGGARSAAPMIEHLEARRLLSDVMMNSIANDDATYMTQIEPSVLVYTPSGSNTPTIVSAYEDKTVQPRLDPSKATGTHVDTVSVSNDGGTSYIDPADSAPLPAGPNGAAYGDNGNAVMARNNATGEVYLATVLHLRARCADGNRAFRRLAA